MRLSGHEEWSSECTKVVLHGWVPITKGDSYVVGGMKIMGNFWKYEFKEHWSVAQIHVPTPTVETWNFGPQHGFKLQDPKLASESRQFINRQS